MKIVRVVVVAGVLTTGLALLGVSHASASTPKVSKPGRPYTVKAIGINTAIRVTWKAPPNGGSPITGYTVTFTPGPKTCKTSGALNCTLVGLTNGKKYTATVQASNVKGLGNPSSPAVVAAPNTNQNCSYIGQYANLQGCSLNPDTLINTNLPDVNLTHANMTGSDLADLTMKGATLTDADLHGATTYNVDLTNAKLTSANLSNADLGTIGLENANLSSADLADATFNGADLFEANLTGANLTGVSWMLTTCPDGTNSNNDAGTCANDLG